MDKPLMEHNLDWLAAPIFPVILSYPIAIMYQSAALIYCMPFLHAGLLIPRRRLVIYSFHKSLLNVCYVLELRW